MKSINVYAGSQRWFHEIGVASRPAVFGWCQDQERVWRAAASA